MLSINNPFHNEINGFNEGYWNISDIIPLRISVLDKHTHFQINLSNRTPLCLVNLKENFYRLYDNIYRYDDEGVQQKDVCENIDKKILFRKHILPWTIIYDLKKWKRINKKKFNKKMCNFIHIASNAHIKTNHHKLRTFGNYANWIE